MADRMTNIQLLIMMADDLKAQGDDLAVDIREQGAAHARKVVELLDMLSKAKEMLEGEYRRFQVYLPRQRQEQVAGSGGGGTVGAAGGGTDTRMMVTGGRT